MVDTLARKSCRAVLCLGLLLALLAGSLPVGATVMVTWDEVTAVNKEGLVAAARKYLSPQEAGLLEQAISKEEDHNSPGHKQEFRPPLVRLKHYGYSPSSDLLGFMRDLIDIIKPCLARGDHAKVKQFFQVINQQKLIRGYGVYHGFLSNSQRRGSTVIQLELRQSPQKEFHVEVWYRLVPPGIKDGKKHEGSRDTYGTGITAP